jgi:hypothetical protein
MSILVGRSREAFADLIQAVNNKTTFTVASVTDAPSINVQNIANIATYRANNYIFGAVNSNFLCSNVTTGVTPLILGTTLAAAVPATFALDVVAATNVSVGQSLSVASNLTARAIDTSNIYVKAAASTNAVVEVAINGASVLSLTGQKVLSHSGSMGIGTTAPAEALHVTSNVRVDGALTAGTLFTTRIGSNATANNTMIFTPSNILVVGEMEVEKFTINGSFVFRSNLTLDSLTVADNFDVSHMTMDNSNTIGNTTLKLTHRVDGYMTGGTYTYCNALPLIDASVALSNAEPFKALYVDAFGRMSLGNAAPTHLLNLDVQPYNSNALVDGLIYAKSLVSNVANVFVVDAQARIGVGTATPAHALHVVIDDSYDTAAFAIENKANYAVPFLRFSSNMDALFDIDAKGTVSIGSNAASVGRATGDAAGASNAFLKVRGDASFTDTLWTNGLRATGASGIIQAPGTSIAGMSNLTSSNVAATVVNATSVNATTVNTTNVNMEGFIVNASAGRITASLNEFLSTGSNMRLAPSTVADANGILQVAAPMSTPSPLAARLSGNGPILCLANVKENTQARNSMRINMIQSEGLTGYIQMNDSAANANLSMGFGTADIVKYQITSSVPSALFFDATLQLTSSDSRFGSTTNPKPVYMYGDLTVAGSNTSVNARVSDTLRATTARIDNNILIGGTLTAQHTILSSSDSNLKTDIVPIAEALAKVQKLTGYTFTRKDTGAADTGLIAQEVAAILPQAVGKDADNYLAVAYGNLAGLFVEAIKELSARCEALEARI